MRMRCAKSSAALLAAISLAGCAAGAAGVPAPVHPELRAGRQSAQYLYVANAFGGSYSSGAVTVYRAGTGALARTITDGINEPTALAFDTSGDLFVANTAGSSTSGGGNVTEYAPGGSTVLRTYQSGDANQWTWFPELLAFDASGKLYVGNTGYGDGGSVVVYAPPSTARLATIRRGVQDPRSIALDAQGDLYVANGYRWKNGQRACGWVTEYAPNSTRVARTLTIGLHCPNVLAFDAHKNLYVLNINNAVPPPSGMLRQLPHSGPFISVFGPGASQPDRVITSGLNYPVSMTFDTNGKLYVANAAGTSVSVFAPGGSTPAFVIDKGMDHPQSVAVGAQGRVYVANYSPNGSVTVYAPNRTRPMLRITDGVSFPFAVALSAH